MKLFLKIKLYRVSGPAVWRRIVIPSKYSFHQLHEAIQIAMGWTNSHLYEFDDSKPLSRDTYACSFRIAELYEYCDEYDEPTFDAHTTSVTDYLKKVGDSLTYTYDLGDTWRHKVTLVAIKEGNCKKPMCVDGEGKCPPEDVGGVHGYATMKKILAQRRNSEEKESYRIWLGLEEGEDWNPSTFDKREVNALLVEFYTHWNRSILYGE